MSTKRISVRNGQTKAYIKVVAFAPITFYDAKLERQIIILYSLGEDGIVREFNNNKWTGFPIQDESVL
jgi:hypothetical protein